MNIECILQRKGGTVVDLPGQTYHFTPRDEDGKHVADVSIESHIERFLSITEAYRLVRATSVELPAIFAAHATAPEQVDSADVLLLGSDTHPSTFNIDGKTYSLGDIVARAFATSGMDTEAWNELDDETRATKIDITLDDIADGAIQIEQSTAEPAALPEPAEPAPAPELTRKELIDLYVAKFNKKPSNATSIDAIKAKLAE